MVQTNSRPKKHGTRDRRTGIKRGIAKNALDSTIRRKTPADRAGLDAYFRKRGTSAVAVRAERFHARSADFAGIFRLERTGDRKPVPGECSYRDSDEHSSPAFTQRRSGSWTEVQPGSDRKRRAHTHHSCRTAQEPERAFAECQRDDLSNGGTGQSQGSRIEASHCRFSRGCRAIRRPGRARKRFAKTLRLEFCPKSKSVKRTPEGFPEFVQKQPRPGGAGGGQCVPASNSRFLDDRISASAVKYLPGAVPAGSRSESCGSSRAD